MPLMQVKSESFTQYVAYEARLQLQHGVKIKVVHSDRGGEFLSDDFKSHLERQGILQQLTVHDTSEHNGIAECVHLTIFNGVRTVLLASDLPKWLWGYTLNYIVYVYNRTPRKPLNMKSPFECRFNVQPDVSNLHEWGTRVYIMTPSQSKLDARAVEGR